MKPKPTHYLDEKKRDKVREDWEKASASLPTFGAKRIYHSGQIISQTGHYSVHNSTGKLMLYETLHMKKDANPKRFPLHGMHPAWYLLAEDSG